MEIYLGGIEKPFKSGREALEWLSQNGQFVFHGSDQKLTRLEPRQQTQYNPQTNRAEPDGEPAICAAASYEFAIFRSLINKNIDAQKNRGHRSSFGQTNGKSFFKATQEAIDDAQKPDSRGYVHVFPKQGFQEHNIMEYRAYSEMEPVYTITVTGADLPTEIEVIE